MDFVIEIFRRHLCLVIKGNDDEWCEDWLRDGHSPALNYGTDLPMQAANLWHIDTGVASKGRLTIMDGQSKVYWQSDPWPVLYPGEKGLNK